MLRSRTTFIVGAGASAEAKLPVGGELTGEIAKLIDFKAAPGGRSITQGDGHIFETLLALMRSGDEWKENHFFGSGQALAEALELASSIDAFLETHAANPEFVLLGKLGIVRAIANAERKSLFRSGRDNRGGFKMRDLGGTWYIDLARQLFTGIPANRPALAFEGVSFIVFNYDRCLQVFLVAAMMKYFLIPQTQAIEIVSNVTIIHPYGWLGSPFGNSDDRVPYAAESFDLSASAGRILTYSEATESQVAQAIKHTVRRAESIVFLGFAFHEQNMRLIDPKLSPISNPRPSRVFATTYGLSASDTAYVEDEISQMFWADALTVTPTVNSANAKCHDFFQAFWRSISAEAV